MIRVSRITFAFRNKTWPKPMEGLDLFNPVPKLAAEPDSPSPTPPPIDSNEYWDEDEDDDEEEDEEESVMSEESDGNYDMEVDDGDEDYNEPASTRPTPNKRPTSDLTLRIGKNRNSGGELKVTTATAAAITRERLQKDLKDESSSNASSSPSSREGGGGGGGGGGRGNLSTSFQVEKQQGLKMTFRKSNRGIALRNEATTTTQQVASVIVKLHVLNVFKHMKKKIEKHSHKIDKDYSESKLNNALFLEIVTCLQFAIINSTHVLRNP